MIIKESIELKDMGRLRTKTFWNGFCLYLRQSGNVRTEEPRTQVQKSVSYCNSELYSRLPAFCGFAISFILCLCLPKYSLAEESAFDATESLPETSPAKTLATTDWFWALDSQWEKVVNGIEAEDFSRTSEELKTLHEIKVKAGIQVLEGHSLALVTEGLKRLREGKKEEASFFAEYALQLSPQMPSVVLKSLRLTQATGVSSIWDQGKIVLTSVWRYPEKLLEFACVILYPTLWALTFGLFATYLLFFSHRIRDVLGVTARLFPQGWRGLLGPWVSVILLLFPIVIGPLWCLALWALLFLLIPGKKWLVAWTGALLVAWGGGIIVRENLARHMDDASFRQVLRVVAGIYSEVDEMRLQEIVSRSKENGLAWWAYGQVLRRKGDLSGASQAFRYAKNGLGEDPGILAQLGSVAFLEKRLEEADKLYKQAEAEGMHSVEFLYNFSKIKFHLFDTEGSRRYDAEAFRMDQERVSQLKEREELLGDAGNFLMADLRMPLFTVLGQVLRSKAPATSSESTLAKVLMWGLSAQLIMVAGGMLILSWFFAARSSERPRRNPTFYPAAAKYTPFSLLLCLIPGGAWIRGGRPALCFFVLSLTALTAMPLIGWPYQSTSMFTLWPTLRTYYLIGVLMFLVLVDCFGFYFVEDKPDAEWRN